MKAKERKETRKLPVKLTPSEFEERAVELAKCDDELARIDGEKKEAVDEFKRQAGTVISRKNELRAVVQEKVEDRDVNCEWRENFKQKCWDLFRLDTNKKVDTQAMSREDLQGTLDVGGDAEATDADGKGKKSRKERGKKDEAGKK